MDIRTENMTLNKDFLFLLVNFNPLHTAQCCLSVPPENIRKPLGFLIFLGGIDKQHRAVMG